jgi:hypothetical protein
MIPPPRFSNRVGTSTSLVVIRRVGVSPCPPGMGWGGSGGCICCAAPMIPAAAASTNPASIKREQENLIP